MLKKNNNIKITKMALKLFFEKNTRENIVIVNKRSIYTEVLPLFWTERGLV
jgi:hypothetical protein